MNDQPLVQTEQTPSGSHAASGATQPAEGEKSPRAKRSYTHRALNWCTPIPPADEGETVLKPGTYPAEVLEVERLEGDGRKAPVLRMRLQLGDPAAGGSDRTSLALHLRAGAEALVRELCGAFLGLNTRDAFIPPWDELKGAKARALVSGARWGDHQRERAEAQDAGRTFISRFEPLPRPAAPQEAAPTP